MSSGGGLFDLRSVLLCIVLIELFLSAIMILYWRKRGGYPGFGIWTIALISLAIAHLNIMLRGIIPDVVSIFATNLFSILGFLLIYEAVTRYYTGVPLDRRWYVFIPLIFVGVIIWYFVYPSIALRSIILAICALILSYQVARLFYKNLTGSNDLFTWLNIVNFSILAVIFVLRIVDYSINTQERPLLQSSFTTDFLFLYSIFATVGSTLLFIIINFDRLSTERDAAMTQIKRLADRYDLAIKTARAGVWEIDLSTNELTVDDQVYRMLGKNREQSGFPSLVLSDVIYPEDLPEILRIVKGVTKPDQEVSAEYRVIKEDGEIRYHISHAKSSETDKDAGLHLIGMSIDITPLRQTQNALKKAMNKLTILSGITRHDILNCSTIIRMNIYLLLDVITDSSILKRLQIIADTEEKITQLIQFTGEYEKLGLHEPQWIDITDILSRMSVSTLIQDRILISPPKGVTIFADPMIEKVLYNLIDNSIRHGGSVTTITISYAYEGKELIVVYSDDGVGIEPDDKNRIFNQGYGKNTGMGLFLCREILALTDISIDETGIPGEGVRFLMRVKYGLYKDERPDGYYEQ